MPYKTCISWGQITDFSDWEHWTRASFLESSFVGCLLQKLLFEMSIAYWNVHQKPWGEFSDTARFFPVQLGEIHFTDDCGDFWQIAAFGVEFSIEKGKTRRDPFIGDQSMSAANWAKWFAMCRLEIARHNLCHAYCGERHMLKDCEKSLELLSYQALCDSAGFVR